MNARLRLLRMKARHWKWKPALITFLFCFGLGSGLHLPWFKPEPQLASVQIDQLHVKISRVGIDVDDTRATAVGIVSNDGNVKWMYLAAGTHQTMTSKTLSLP